MSLNVPKLITGAIYHDNRGIVKYVNGFDMSDSKRFYQITNSNTDLLRGWQAHKVERKWFYAAKGKFKIFLVKIDNWVNHFK